MSYIKYILYDYLYSCIHNYDDINGPRNNGIILLTYLYVLFVLISGTQFFKKTKRKKLYYNIYFVFMILLLGIFYIILEEYIGPIKLT